MDTLSRLPVFGLMATPKCCWLLLIAMLRFQHTLGFATLQSTTTHSQSSFRQRSLTNLFVGGSLFSSRKPVAKGINATTYNSTASSSASSSSTATLLAKVVQSANARQAAITKNETPPIKSVNDLVLIPDELLAGIGGLNGTSYDVNRLKRNLLQEVVQAYKQELHTLLQSYYSTEQEIVEKLSALVQSSPVRTTTDSNLLDGRWVLAYRSKHCCVRDLKQQRARLPKRQRRALAQNVLASTRRSGKERLARTFFRTVHLEEDDDDVSIEDSMHVLGHFLRRSERYRVCGLTRQSLDVQKQSSKWYLLHRLVKQRTIDPKQKAMKEPPESIQVVYLDVDLCILTNSNSEDGENSTFSVYTKNEAWLDHSTKRQAKFLAQAMRYFIFGKLLRKRQQSLDEYWWSNRDTDEVNRILQEIRIENSSRLRVLRLGDTENVDDDAAWEGKGDPFVHLSADERQRALKTMNMRQIEIAGNQRLSKASREGWLQRLIPKRKSFRRPKNI
ncbi:hypothetical protein MPSEU_000700000 [Mayamaea pseudoterrestris]|nr:hypothetical protein MPSEU_000700000 [Mayamaea pseudoterrestris]